MKTKDLQYLRAIVTFGLCAFTLHARAQYSPPTTGLVSWWRANGNANDAIGANNGVGQNGVGYGSGVSGTAFSMDGVDDRVFVPADPSLNVGLGSGFTIGLWIKPQTLDQQDLVEWNNGMGTFGVHMTLSVPAYGGGVGSLWGNVIDTGGTEHQITTGPDLISTTSFQHVALSYDKTAGTAKLYLNGSIVASTHLGSFTPYTSSDLYFGARVSGPFTGLQFSQYMDEVTLYNRALSDSEVVELATVPEPSTAGLIFVATIGSGFLRRFCPKRPQ